MHSCIGTYIPYCGAKVIYSTVPTNTVQVPVPISTGTVTAVLGIGTGFMYQRMTLCTSQIAVDF